MERRVEVCDGDSTAGLRRDPATASYYLQRAAEYDEWYEGVGLFSEQNRPGWDGEVRGLVELVAGLPAARTLDVRLRHVLLAQRLTGFVAAEDQSSAMIAMAQQRLLSGAVAVGDALALPFTDGAFDRVLTGHFYGHLPTAERGLFLAEVSRVATELTRIVSSLRRRAN